jgi:hypothetical protein
MSQYADAQMCSKLCSRNYPVRRACRFVQGRHGLTQHRTAETNAEQKMWLLEGCTFE